MTFTNEEKLQILDLLDNPENLVFSANTKIPLPIQQLENSGYLLRVNKSLTLIELKQTQKMIDEMSTWNRDQVKAELKQESKRYEDLSPVIDMGLL